jgi:hypothetical protein
MELTALDTDYIDNELNGHGYLIVRDAAIERICADAREEYLRCLRFSKLHPTREKFHYSALSNQPWRKLAIGSTNGLGVPYAQNLQSIYFDSGDPNYPALGSLFKTMLLI